MTIHSSLSQTFKIGWRHCTKFKHVLKAEGGTLHICKLICRVVRSGRVGSGRVGSDQNYYHSVENPR